MNNFVISLTHTDNSKNYLDREIGYFEKYEDAYAYAIKYYSFEIRSNIYNVTIFRKLLIYTPVKILNESDV